VDAAYGGFALLTERGRAALTGIEAADSVTLDPHKWLYQPFEAGCLLVRHGRLLADAFHIMPDYLQDTAVAAGELPEVNFADRGLQLTRCFRALKIWLSLKSFGTDAFRQAIDRTMDLAAYAEERIRARPEVFEMLSPAALGIVCFQRRLGGDTEARNAALVRDLAASGTGMISSTRVRGRYALRLCILSHRTTAADVDAVLDWLAAADSPAT
jgi:glutamate/tyrosine decarboxylase-like PLP-dependent enzyme